MGGNDIHKRQLNELKKRLSTERAKNEVLQKEVQELRDRLQEEQKRTRILSRKCEIRRKSNSRQGSKKTSIDDRRNLNAINNKLSIPEDVEVEAPFSFSADKISFLNSDYGSEKRIKELEVALEQQRNTIEQQEKDLHLAADEIELLARALEIRVEGLSPEGDIKSILLREIAMCQKENQKLERNNAESKEMYAKTKLKVSELEKELEDTRKLLKLTRREAETLDLDLDESKRALKSFLEERELVLEYLKDNSAQKHELEVELSKAVARAVKSEQEKMKFLDLQEHVLGRIDQLEAGARTQKLLELSSFPEVPSIVPCSLDKGEPIEIEKKWSDDKCNCEIRNQSKLLEENTILKEKIKILDKALETERFCRKKTDSRLHQLNENRERCEVRLRSKVKRLEAELEELQNNSPTNVSIDLSFKPPLKTEEYHEKENKHGFQDIERRLNLALKARDIMEQEAARLGKENARLKRKLKELL